jgi:hypothetical protein
MIYGPKNYWVSWGEVCTVRCSKGGFIYFHCKHCEGFLWENLCDMHWVFYFPNELLMLQSQLLMLQEKENKRFEIVNFSCHNCMMSWIVTISMCKKTYDGIMWKKQHTICWNSRWKEENTWLNSEYAICIEWCG